MIHPTRRLVALAAATALLALAAMALPWLAGPSWVALAVTAGLALVDGRSARRKAAPAVARELPKRARLGEPFDLRYRVQLDEPARLTLLDELPADLGGDQQFGALDAAAGTHALERKVVPRRRGTRAFGPIHAAVLSPLGLFTHRFTLHAEQALQVYPSDALKGHDGPVSRKVRSELGIKPRRPRGEGSEFESLREYTLDDEPRRIDWRASARVRRPVVREYQTERNHTLIVAVDCGRLMGTHIDGVSKLDHALAAAIGLLRASAQCRDRVGFLAFDRELRAWVPPQRAGRALAPILEATLALEPRADESSYRVLAEAMQQRQKKRALLVVLTDFVEGASSVELDAYLTALGVRHCVLLVGLRDRLLRELDEPAQSLEHGGVYRRLALQDLDVARDVALSQIARRGLHTLDLDPAAITGPLLDRYLQIREAGLL